LSGILTSWTDEVFALVGNGVPVPLEELDDDLWEGECESDHTALGCCWDVPFPEFCLGDGAAAARASRNERVNSPCMTGRDS